MAYTKHTWTTGEVITAGRLNNMEDGIADAGGVMVISNTYDKQADLITLDKTWQEIYDAMARGKLCVRTVNTGNIGDGICNHIVSNIYFIDSEGKYKVDIGESTYSATSADGYPVYG